jgi:Tfp pilus assembly protein PilP
MTMMILTFALAFSGLAQIPDPSAAIGAAKRAKAQTEAAQQKNAEALDQTKTPPAGAPGAPAAPAPQAGQAPPPAQGAGYSYDPAGRRDPFVSLTGRGADLPSGVARPSGLGGLLVNDITVKGVLKSPKGGFIALVQAPDNRTYIIHAGEKVFDGSVKTITLDAVVFSQDVNDPLSLVKQREVRKAIRPEAR